MPVPSFSSVSERFRGRPLRAIIRERMTNEATGGTKEGMGLIEDLDDLDRRVFGETGLRAIYRWAIPLFLVILGAALLVRDLLGEPRRFPVASLGLVAMGVVLLAARLGPPPRAPEQPEQPERDKPGNRTVRDNGEPSSPTQKAELPATF